MCILLQVRFAHFAGGSRKRNQYEVCLSVYKVGEQLFEIIFFSRFHLAAEHYFREGKFKDLVPPSQEDLEPGKLLPNDLLGKQFKYSCDLQPCTKRKLGYKEMVLHLATQHKLLKEVMQKDKRPGIAAVLKALYPEEGEQKMVQDMVRLSSEPANTFKYFDFLAQGKGCRSCGQREAREEDWR